MVGFYDIGVYNMKELTNDNYYDHVMDKGRNTIAMFYGIWCRPCKLTKPIFKRLQDSGDLDIDFVLVNIDEAPDVVQQEGIMSVPTFIIYKDGEQVGRKSSAMQEKELVDFINSHIKE